MVKSLFTMFKVLLTILKSLFTILKSLLSMFKNLCIVFETFSDFACSSSESSLGGIHLSHPIIHFHLLHHIAIYVM